MLAQQHKNLEQFLSKLLSDKIETKVDIKSLIVDPKKSDITLYNDKIKMVLAISSINATAHIRERIFLFDVDEDISLSITNTYISLNCKVNPDSDILQFSNITGNLDPTFIKRVNLKFSGILANITYQLTHMLFSSWIQSEIVEKLLTNKEGIINDAISKLQSDGVTFTFQGVHFNFNISTLKPVAITPEYIDIVINGSLTDPEKLTVVGIELNEQTTVFDKIQFYATNLKKNLGVYLSDQWNSIYDGTSSVLGDNM